MKRITHILLFLLILVFSNPMPFQASSPLSLVRQESVCQVATIHYRRRNEDYDRWGLHVWGKTPLDGQVTWSSPLSPADQDDFGLVWQIELNPGAAELNYVIHRGEEKDPGPDQVMVFNQVGCEIWQVQGKLDQFSDPQDALEALVITTIPSPPLQEDQVILHYRRIDGDYDGWGLHIWGPTAVSDITWTSPLLPNGYDEFGIYWIIAMQPNANHLEYIVHKGDLKDPGPDQKLDLSESGREAWLIQGDGAKFPDSESAKQGLIASALGDIKNKAQAHWLSREFIAWPVKFSRDAEFSFHYDLSGGLRITPEGLQGGQSFPLEFVSNILNDDLAGKFPHLWSARLLKIPDGYLDMVPEILKGQYAIRAVDAEGTILGTTALQIPGVLDHLYANDHELGISWQGSVPTLNVWAPTAKSVQLHIYDHLLDIDSVEEENGHSVFPMDWDQATGIWTITGEPVWKNKYYLFEVEVYVRQEGAVVTNLVTDPYSLGLSTNSLRSQIVDLNDQALYPENWTSLGKPPLGTFSDIALYELHLRDFSIRDLSVPEEHRGTFLAFTHPDSKGMQHLKWLAENGVTHVHLLPVFDIATINENKAEWQKVDWETLQSLSPDSEEQQAIITEIRGQDGFNWGYDPFHYTVPEGSYSLNPNSNNRILEFRQMVQSLNQLGLRVVMDVVYNHTNASGQSEKSVLDRIVPGYYHRLDENGRVQTSTCCQNTATEHAMMRRLMIDSVLTWATAYKIDGFRFDLMGHHMKVDMVELRSSLDRLSLADDGVDGEKIYVYGEGWDFGEVADGARGENATQLNMAGTGIGTFNDRLRDAVRGGSPFSGHSEQGYATGLFTDPNDTNVTSAESQRVSLMKLKDQIRISLAGNLMDFELVNYKGDLVTGAEIKYNNHQAGYTKSPLENIVYVSAHDNETLFDAIQYKAPRSTSLEDRVKIQNLALSLVTFSQGVPFYHAGSELLRSKSMDRDSYDSTDWFNAIDWTYQDNNWGHGLPPQDKNGSQWPIIRDLLANPSLAPGHEHILMSRDIFGSLLKIRGSSPLFTLQTAEQINNLVHFHNTGPDQVPGLIVMSILDDETRSMDTENEVIFVIFNTSPEMQAYQLQGWQMENLELHPSLVDTAYASGAGFDLDNQTFHVPPRSTTVFISPSRPVVSIIDHPTQEQTEGDSEDIAETTSHESQPEPTTVEEIKTPIITQSTGVEESHPKTQNIIGYLAGLFLVILAGLSLAAFRFRRKRIP